MFKDVIITYKKNKLSMVITIIILSLFIFSTSIAFSIIFNIIHEMKDNNNVNEDKINIQMNSQKDIKIDELSDIIFSKIDGVKSIPIDRVIINEKKSCELVAVDSNRDFNLHINILKGEKFSSDDFSEKKVLIGKLLESETFKIAEKQYINIENESYEVIGIMGDENLISLYDLSIYIPIKSLPQKAKEKHSTILNFSVYTKNKESIESAINKLDFIDTYSIIEENKASFYDIFMESYKYSINNIVTLVMTILIALINMIISSQIWIESQKYAIAIKKALGASNKRINVEFFLLMLGLSIISSIISVLFQSMFSKIMWELFCIDITVLNSSIIYAIAISFITALGITLYQVKQVVKVSVANFIQE